MLAVTIADGRLVVAERPDPEPGRGELLVRVAAAGLNGADLHQLKGRYPARPGSPADIPGLELAGEVAAVGPDVFGFGKGDRVMAVVGGGGQAELAVVHERVAIPVPDGLGWPEAGGFPRSSPPPTTPRSPSAASASATGCWSTAPSAGSGRPPSSSPPPPGPGWWPASATPDHHRAVADLGAAVVTEPGQAFDHGPFDVILELVGAPNVPANVDALATGGRLMVIGVGAGATAELDLRKLMTRRARVLASNLRSRPLEQKADAAHRVGHQALPLVADGRLRVPVAATFPLARAQQAHDRFAADAKLGKLVLVT
jgi:NADPH:quinone reductase